MPLFRKKPVIIDAFQMTKARRMDVSEWPTWLLEAWNRQRNELGAVYSITADGQLTIQTLEGRYSVSWDDWIIRGIKGELYPCKPDIFELTYERCGLDS